MPRVSRRLTSAHDALADDGAILIADELDEHAIAALALDPAMKVRGTAITAGYRNYLQWHRERVFRASRAAER